MSPIVRSLDLSYVHLAKCKDFKPNPSDLMPSFRFKGLQVVHHLSEAEVIGYGILFFDSADPSNLKLQVLTSLSSEEMKQVNCLVKPNGVSLPPDLTLECYYK